jgi:hypothetical protein
MKIARSHEIEFSFLNANLMVPAGHLFIFKCDGNESDGTLVDVS